MFGLKERKNDENDNKVKVYFEIVAKRDRATLLKIILKRVRPGLIICNDSWSAYQDIINLDKNFKHVMINHSLHFVKPGLIDGNKVHTNGIESEWNNCKRRFKQMNGCSRGH